MAPSCDRPLFVVFNESSGAQTADAVRATIETELRQAGRRFEILACSARGGLKSATCRAVALARDAGGGVVAAGGDGTLNAVAQAALEAELPFGAIALGTFNYFARAQSLPLDVAEATRATLPAGLRPVQVGLVNGRIFLVNASLGLYPQLLADREHFKGRFGRHRLVAFVAALGTLLHAGKRLHLQVETPQETLAIRTAALVVANNRLQLEQLGLPEADAVEQGRLVAMFVKPAAPAALLRLLSRALLRRLDGADEVERLSIRRLRIDLAGRTRGGSLTVAVDGESLRLALPVEFSVAPRPLWLIAA